MLSTGVERTLDQALSDDLHLGLRVEEQRSDTISAMVHWWSAYCHSQCLFFGAMIVEESNYKWEAALWEISPAN